MIRTQCGESEGEGGESDNYDDDILHIDTHSTLPLQLTVSSCSMSALACISAARQAVSPLRAATISDVKGFSPQPYYMHV